MLALVVPELTHPFLKEGVNLTVERIVGILPKNQLICVVSDYSGEQFYKGAVWALDSKYILSFLATDVWLSDFYVIIEVLDYY